MNDTDPTEVTLPTPSCCIVSVWTFSTYRLGIFIHLSDNETNLKKNAFDVTVCF